MPDISLTAPVSPYAIDAQAIARQRQMADMLRAQSFQPVKAEQVNGIPTAASPLEYLGKLLQSYTGGKMQEGLDTKQLALAQQIREQAAQQMGSMPQGTPATPAQPEQITGDPIDAMNPIATPAVPAQPGQDPSRASMQSWAMGLQNSGNPLTGQLGTQMLAKYLTPVSADTLATQQGQDRRFAGVSGNTQADLAQKAQQFAGVSGNTAATIGNAQQMHATPSGSAMLGAQTAIRGQNMVDARTRELNGIMEGQGGIDTGPVAQAIASGDMAMPTITTRNPAGMMRAAKLVADVKQINPNWTADTYPTTQTTMKAYAVGKQGQTVKALNTSIDHLDTLGGLSDALQNGNIQAVNKFANAFAAQVGSAPPNTFNAAKDIVGNEIIKAIVGAGGGVGDREKAAETLSRANSPAQLKAVIDNYKTLMGGQLKGLEQEYVAGTNGRKDFRDKYLTSAARAAFDNAKHQGGGVGASPEDQQALAWANANPSDPRAAKIKARLGQ